MNDENDGIRDIHYMKTRYRGQIKRLRKDIRGVNFNDWELYEKWLIGRGLKLGTILKRLFCLKATFKLYPIKNLKNISKKQVIELNYKIVSSEYEDTTKYDLQLFIRDYLLFFSKLKKRRDEIKNIIKLPSKPYTKSDELITPSDFRKILKNMPTPQMKLMVLILYATGMRITEVYNIKPKNIKFIKKKFGLFTLPPCVFGYKAAWIYTKGKRTAWIKDGSYEYYMVFFLEDLRNYIKSFNPDVYCFNVSYVFFCKKLHEAAEKEGINLRVHPHLFRHTVANDLFDKYSDQNVDKIMNWSPNSKMPKTYSHMKERNIANTMDDFKKIRKL